MIRADRSTYPAVEVQDGDQLALADALPESPGRTILTPEQVERVKERLRRLAS